MKLLATLVLSFILPTGTTATGDTHIMQGVVTSVNDYVYVSTNDGNGWALDGTRYNVGESLLLVFDDMGTPSIYDDEIIQVYKEVK